MHGIPNDYPEISVFCPGDFRARRIMYVLFDLWRMCRCGIKVYIRAAMVVLLFV